EQLIESDAMLRAVHQFVHQEFEHDPAHDIPHLYRVALWTIRLAGRLVPTRNAVAAALLHDLVNVPKNSPMRSRASELSAEKARPLLTELGFPSDDVSDICAAIRDHSFSRGARPTSPLGEALQDADRLEALGAIGIARCFATGGRMGISLWHPDDPWAQSRPLNDATYSLDHFFAKLLKLPDTFLTEAGREEAHRRAARLARYIDQLGEELGEARP
ncbi:MAG: HD domain-containing protein, partial [Bdellovibrionales bacterium]|nr:HD domain-containing protein [Bdellovibrionales bacterium]